jgi:hypothetical protein
MTAMAAGLQGPAAGPQPPEDAWYTPPLFDPLLLRFWG